MSMTFVKKIKLWQMTILLLVVSFIYFGSLFFSRESFSASDVGIFISGPDNFNAQEKVEFELKLRNKSKFNLQGALYVTLPEFLAFQDADTNEQRVDFDMVRREGEFLQKITLFAKDTQKQGAIKVRAEYTPKGFNGRFEADSLAHVSVSSLPITVIFDLPEKAVDGQALRGSFHFIAQKELEVKPLLARLILPEDFILKDSEPKPKDTTTWEFSEVNPGASYRVDFEGIVKGYEGVNKRFDLLFGINEKEFSFVEQYKISREVKISSAPIRFQQTVNGTDDYIASAGEELKFSISYENKSSVSIEDIVITAVLSGQAFDLTTLAAGTGYFNENTRTLIWNKDFFDELTVLNKDENGKVEFVISIKKDISPKDYKDKNISLKSRAIIDSPKPSLALRGLSLRSEDTSEIKLRTSIDLSMQALYYEGPFSNAGPIPPKVGEKTAYTIVWKAGNSLNEITQARVEVALPQGVFFEQKIYPASSNLVYNSQMNQMIWNIGTLKPGVGSVFPAETVTFGISIIPTESMRGFLAELIEKGKITGTDSFTNEFIEYEFSALNTALPEDEGMREGDGVVQ